jgi:hypothetical protein
MSRTQRDTYHAARALQSTLARIASKRDRAISKANADFQLELIQTVTSSAAPIVRLVRQVLREDVGQLHLSRALEATVESVRDAANDSDDDEHERVTEAPFELAARHAPSEPVPRTEVSGDWVTGDGSGTALPPIDAEFEEAASDPETPEIVFEGYRYRYPDPGENAATLGNGEVVAADDRDRPIRLGAAP